MIKKITSTSNQTIKGLLHLQKSNERKSRNLIVIEGIRELNLAVVAGFQIQSLFYCPEIVDKTEWETLSKKLSSNVEINELTAEVFNKIAYRNDCGGVVALSIPKILKLSDIKLSKNPLIIVLETVEKPGNLGAILRTADAANYDAVLVCDNQTDIYNPNVIRSSLGCIFTNQVVSCTSEEAIRWMKEKKIRIYSTALTATKSYHQTDYTLPTAIVMGSEANGLTDLWLKESDKLIKIPMRGKVDSMNVSASAAIVMYEALRQRNFCI